MDQYFSMQPCRPRWCLFNESKVPISTFIPTTISLVQMVNSDGETANVRVKLCFEDGKSTETTVSLSNLNYVNWFEIDHRCIINSEWRRARGYIADIIRVGIGGVPVEKKYVLDRTGIYHFDKTIVFAAGDRVITSSSATEDSSNFELEQQSRFHLDVDDNISPCETIQGMIELVRLSPEIGKILVAHAISGIIRAAFKESGFTPCAVLAIIGESGMLKSHYVPHIVQLYDRADGIGPVTRFNSTKRFIEDTLYEYSECTAVIDDLHTAESKGIKRRNEDTAEEIIRRIADDTGRGRMDGSAKVQRHFRGNAVFIGEYTIGKASTIPRALVVKLTKPPNGAILDKYQRNQPLLVSTFYFYFIQWYVDNFEEIREGIDRRLTKFRRENTAPTTHGRLRDTEFYLQISFMIFLRFCEVSGICSDEDVKDTYNDFCSQLCKIVQAQEARYRECEEAKTTDYLALIRNLYKKDAFDLAKNAERFNKKEHDGLIWNGHLCLRGKCLGKKIMCISSYLNLDDCINDLLLKDALKLIGKKYTIQVYGTGGIRFYAIKLSKLK